MTNVFDSARQRRTNELILERLERNSTMVQHTSLHSAKLASNEGQTSDLVAPDEHLAARSRQQYQKARFTRRSNNSADRAWRGRAASTAWSFRLTPWFMSVIWEVNLNIAQHDVHFSIQTCNIVPEESPIFDLCSIGDLPGVMRLFSEGKASPRDRDLRGRTTFTVCSLSPRLVTSLS